jgi:hypothetical protein
MRPTFNYTYRQIEKYRDNGIVVARLDDINPSPIDGCRINTELLLQHERPAHAWVRQTDAMPKVIVASERIKTVSESALSLDVGRELLYLELSWDTSHPKVPCFEPRLTPFYGE